jgi:quinol monooxygenase YgiN
MSSTSKVGRLMTMRAQPGRGDELAALLLRVANGLSGTSGCDVYLINQDRADPDRVVVMEVWADEESVAAALASAAGGPEINQVLALMAEPPQRTDLVTLGGVGVAPTESSAG